MAEASLENPTDISSRYFEPASTYVNSFQADNPASFTASHAKVYHQYAIFAEHQYKALNSSPDSVRFRVYLERKTRELELRKSQGGAKTKALTDAEKTFESDQEAFRQHNRARETFLAHAIEMYSRALEASDAFDGDGAIRLCSLWFENFDHTETKFHGTVTAALNRIPSRKLIFLAVCLLTSILVGVILNVDDHLASTVCEAFQDCSVGCKPGSTGEHHPPHVLGASVPQSISSLLPAAL
jgi:ataxia telangiectasia mutated family protein